MVNSGSGRVALRQRDKFLREPEHGAVADLAEDDVAPVGPVAMYWRSVHVRTS